MMFDILVSLLLLIGSAFVALGAVGLVRFPDLLTRLHGPTMGTDRCLSPVRRHPLA